MATHAELTALFSHTGLRNSITVAVCKKAHALVTNSPTADQREFALAALKSPQEHADWLLKYLLAANAALTVAQITGASESAIEEKVTEAIEAFYPNAA